MTVNDMFPNTAQTQQEVLHSISHSAFNMLNIFTGIEYTWYKGKMIMHYKKHLHILDTSAAIMYIA
jgi:hypothetical protein